MASSNLNKNGKYFVAPQKRSENFKMLFAHLMTEGAGWPVDEHGFPEGSWSPDKLADAISSFEANSNGIELHAVQVWFQTTITASVAITSVGSRESLDATIQKRLANGRLS